MKMETVLTRICIGGDRRSTAHDNSQFFSQTKTLASFSAEGADASLAFGGSAESVSPSFAFQELRTNGESVNQYHEQR